MSIMDHFSYATRPLVEFNLDIYTERASFLGWLSHMSERKRLAITLDPVTSELAIFKNKRIHLVQIWTQGTLRHILGPILVIFEICQFFTIPGPFEYFSENGWSQKIKVFLMKERSLPPCRLSSRRRGP